MNEVKNEQENNNVDCIFQLGTIDLEDIDCDHT
jgi:hypothetical protein